MFRIISDSDFATSGRFGGVIFPPATSIPSPDKEISPSEIFCNLKYSKATSSFTTSSDCESASNNPFVNINTPIPYNACISSSVKGVTCDKNRNTSAYFAKCLWKSSWSFSSVLSKLAIILSKTEYNLP